MSYINESIIYNIYPLGFCGAPKENDGKLEYRLDKIYDIMTDKEKKDLISYLIKDIQIYSNEEQVEMPLKSITLNFPIYSDSGEVNKLLWENRDGVERLTYFKQKKCF